MKKRFRLHHGLMSMTVGKMEVMTITRTDGSKLKGVSVIDEFGNYVFTFYSYNARLKLAFQDERTVYFYLIEEAYSDEPYF